MTGPPSHRLIEELIAARSLSGLEEEEQRELVREMNRHGPDCSECRRLLTDYAEVGGWLALSLDPLPTSPEEEERLIRAARSSRTQEIEGVTEVRQVEPAEPAERAEQGIPSAPTALFVPLRRWLTAAAVAAALAVGGLVGYSIAPGASGEQQRFLAFVSQPGTRVASFPSTGGQKVAVAFRSGGREAWILGSGLKAPPSGKVYELWFRESPDSPMRPGGTFVPSDGDVLSPARVGVAFDTLAISVEPRGGSKSPTTSPVFLTNV